MSHLSERSSAHTVPLVAPIEEHDLCDRIQAEFREMPGLKLTLPQASRLFGIELTRCGRVLGALVHARCLATDGKTFSQRSEWPSSRSFPESEGSARGLCQPAR